MQQGWSNEATGSVAWHFSQDANIGFALEQAKRHGPNRPHTYGTALVVAAEFARLVDDERAYMDFTGEDGRNILREVNYEELGAGFLAYFAEEGLVP